MRHYYFAPLLALLCAHSTAGAQTAELQPPTYGAHATAADQPDTWAAPLAIPAGTRLDSTIGVDWSGADTFYRVATRYQIASVTYDTLVYTTSINRVDRNTGTETQRRSAVSRYSKPDGTTWQKTLDYGPNGEPLGGEITYAKALPGTDIRIRTAVPLDPSGRRLPDYTVDFDSAYTDTRLKYESYQTFGKRNPSGPYTDSLAVPSPLCFRSHFVRDSSFPAPNHRRSVTQSTRYDSCRQEVRYTHYRNRLFHPDGRVRARVDTTVGLSYSPRVYVAIDTQILNVTYLYLGSTVVREFRWITSNGYTTTPYDITSTYDAQGRLLTEEQFNYERSGAYVRYYVHTFIYEDSREIEEHRYYDSNGEVTFGFRRIRYFSPRVSALSSVASTPACAKTFSRAPDGIRVPLQTAGVCTAYDMTGRPVWQARGQANEDLVFLPSAAGVYALQNADGCSAVVVW